jgi:hypothetical protein
MVGSRAFIAGLASVRDGLSLCIAMTQRHQYTEVSVMLGNLLFRPPSLRWRVFGAAME